MLSFSVLLMLRMFAATVRLLLPHRAGLVFAAQRVIVSVDLPHSENCSQILKQSLQPFQNNFQTIDKIGKLFELVNKAPQRSRSV